MMMLAPVFIQWCFAFGVLNGRCYLWQGKVFHFMLIINCPFYYPNSLVHVRCSTATWSQQRGCSSCVALQGTRNYTSTALKNEIPKRMSSTRCVTDTWLYVLRRRRNEKNSTKTTNMSRWRRPWQCPEIPSWTCEHNSDDLSYFEG